MEFDQIKRELKLPDNWDIVRKNWHGASVQPERPESADSQGGGPEESRSHLYTDYGGGDPSAARILLEERSIRSTAEAIHLRPDTAERLMKSGSQVAGNEAQLRLFSQCCRLMYGDPDFTRQELMSWPLPPEGFGGLDPFFHALVIFAGVTPALEAYRARGIDEATAAAAFKDLQRWIDIYRRNYGQEGFREIKWLIHHVKAEIVELGRLQFLIDTFRSDYRGWRREDGAVILLAPAGLDVDASGIPVIQEEGSPAFTTILHGVGEDHAASGGRPGVEKVQPEERASKEIQGYPVHPDGYIENRPVRLGSDWTEILWPGKAGISYHIPTAGPMDHAACGESFRRAAGFFPRYFPDIPSDIFFTSTWLHDPQLAEYLPATANIVRFQREFYRYPLPGSKGEAIIRFVYGPMPHPVDPNRLKAETTLEKAIVRHLQAGLRWREAGGILVTQDLDWGSTQYRLNRPADST